MLIRSSSSVLVYVTLEKGKSECEEDFHTNSFQVLNWLV